MCRSVYSASKMYMRYAVVRFDAFPKYVVSDVLERTILDAPGDILEWEYNFRRSISAAVFWQKFESDLSGRLGNEVRRLRKHKLLPVLYVNINRSSTMVKVLLIVLGVLIARWISRFAMVSNRRKLTKKELASCFECDEVGIHALSLISGMYSIDQGYLRPDDSLCGEGFLVQYDSWNFNYGYNELEDYVVNH